MDRLAYILLTLALLGGPTFAIAGLELRGKLIFENEIDSHVCSELVRGDHPIAWVHAPVLTSIGLIARVCEESEPLVAGDLASPGAIHGHVKSGWYIIGSEAEMRPLTLPFLGNFSNPTFCQSYAAYWAQRTDAPSSIVLASLDTGEILSEKPIGQLELETDYLYHLTPAIWDSACTSATFVHESVLSKTVLRAKSN